MATAGRRGHYKTPSSLVSPESSPLNARAPVSLAGNPSYNHCNTQQPLTKSCLAIPSVFRKKYGKKQQRRRYQQQQRQQSEPLPPVVSRDLDDDDDEPDWTGPSPQKSIERLLAPPVPPGENSVPIQRRQRRRGLYDGEMEPEGVRGQEATPVAETATQFSLPQATNNGRMQILRPITDAEEDPSVDQLIGEHRPSFDASDGANALHQDSTFFHAPNSTSSQSLKQERKPSVSFVTDDVFHGPSNSQAHHSSHRKSSIPAFTRPSSPPHTTSSHQTPLQSNRTKSFDKSSPARQTDRETSIPSLRSSSSRKSSKHSSVGSRTAPPTPAALEQHQASTHPSETPQIHKTPSFGGRTATTASSRSSSHLHSDAESLMNLGMRKVEAGDYDSAIRLFSKLLQSQLATHGSSHPATASAYHNLGTVHAKRAVETCLEDSLQQQACRNTALECFQAAARAARDSLGPNHPNVAVSLIRVGFILLQSRQYENAVTTFSEALRVRKESFGRMHGLTANVYNNLGVCYMHLDQFEKAWDSLEEALQIQKELAHNNKTASLELSDTLFNRGGLCLEWMRRQGPDAARAGHAVTALQEAYDIRNEYLGQDHPSVVQVRELLAQARKLPVMSSPALSPIARDTSIFRTTKPSVLSPPITHISVVEQKDDTNANQRSMDRKDKSDAATTSDVFESSFENDFSPEKQTGEESCLISESGVETGQGRIHFPLAWNKAGIHAESKRDYQLAGWAPKVESSPGSVFSTGNRARDELMTRARTILDAHSYDGGDIKKVGSEVSSAFVDRAMDASVEDEVAPLGGSWTKPTLGDERPSIQEMLEDPSSYLGDIHNEASRLLKQGEIVDAQLLFDAVVNCQKNKHGPLHPDVASALHNSGITLLRSQKHSEALGVFEEAARIRKGCMGQDHPLVAVRFPPNFPWLLTASWQVSLVKVGITLLLLRRFDDALWTFREALSVRKHALGSLHPSTARIYNNIGCVYVEFSEFKQARRSFEAALDIQRSALSAEQDNSQLMFATATTLCNLGYLYRFRDMHAKATFVLKEALGMQEKVLGKSNAAVLSTLDNLADSCANSGNIPQALTYYETVLSRISSRDGAGQNSHRAKAVLLYKISRVYRKLSNWNEQLQRLKEALEVTRSQPDLVHRSDPLERKILYDIRACRDKMERTEDRV